MREIPPGHDRARLCHATSKRSGKRCRQNCLKKPDGTYTRNCRFHAGGAELLDPGDPARGGRPIVHGIHAKYLPPDLAEDFADGIGDIDEQIRIKRAFLFRAVKKADEDPKGGITTSVSSGPGSKSVSFKPWLSIVAELSDQLRKLRLAKHVIEQSGSPGDPDGGTQDYATWLTGVRSSRRGSSSDSQRAPASSRSRKD